MADVSMDYEMMESMIRAVKEALEKVNEAESDMRKAANKLDGGALVNQHGSQWAENLRNRVAVKLNQSQAMFEELAADLDAAVRFMRDGDTSARGRFN